MGADIWGKKGKGVEPEGAMSKKKVELLCYKESPDLSNCFFGTLARLWLVGERIYISGNSDYSYQFKGKTVSESLDLYVELLGKKQITKETLVKFGFIEVNTEGYL